MIIQLKENASYKECDSLKEMLDSKSFRFTEVKTQLGKYLIALGGNEIDIRSIGNLRAVRDVHAVNDKQQLVSSKWKTSPTVIQLGNNVQIGDESFSVVAGPCSIEGKEQVEEMRNFLSDQQIDIMRGGVFKPRSSPYAFRGVGIEGLKYFSALCHEKNIKVITEVMEAEKIEAMYPYVDIFQVGARNSQNFNLLDALGKVDKPVLLKRGLSGTLEELLYSAEYIFSGGNERIILSERGIRTFEKSYRNTLDLNAIPMLKEKTHLPVIVDPSHGTGIKELVEPMTLASVMSGADGVMIEIHKNPKQAYSDGAQSLNFKQMETLNQKIKMTSEFLKELKSKF
ncbi:MAG: bifunctional 3-deoxy-7-phosphoheptulonate synthase/chorismate mutase [Bacteroidota bacterium]